MDSNDSPSGGFRRAASPRRKGRPRKRPSGIECSGGGTPAGGTAKPRGRPPGSRTKKKEKGKGVGFTVHIITVHKGQDICSIIEEFSRLIGRRVIILTASGVISSVTLFHLGDVAEVVYDGKFFILSLTCSVGESGISGYTLSISGTTGTVYAGEVVGSLIASSPIQVTLGSFVDEVKQEEGSSSAPPPGSFVDEVKQEEGPSSAPPPGSSKGEDDPKSKTPKASSAPPGSSTGEDDPKGKKPKASPAPPPDSSTNEDDPKGKKPKASPAPSPTKTLDFNYFK